MQARRQVPWKHAMRDLSLLVLTLLLWSWSAAADSIPLALAAGVLTAVCGYLLHEWGHLVGAWSGRSVVHLPTRTSEVFLFRFDSDRNSRAQFLRMSLGGFLASGVTIAFLLVVLPLETLAARVALVLALGGVLATVLLEFPPAWKVLRGGDIPIGAAYRSDARSEP